MKSRPSTGFPGPLFVVGMPRSGTKLLRGLLNEHPRIAIPLNETEFLPHWAKRWPRWGDLSKREDFSRFYAEVTGSTYFTQRLLEHGLRVEEETWYRACRDFSLPSVFEALVRHDANADLDTVWGDKSPGYLAHLPLLKHLFPTARVVHVIRDPRDCCLSLKRAYGKSMRRSAYRWQRRVLAARTAAGSFPHDYHELRYEDLLASPASTLRSLCDFLELDFDESMLELSQPTENLGSARGARMIVKGNAGKWRTELTSRQIERVEAAAYPGLIALDYPVSLATGPRPPGRVSLAALQVLDGARLIERDARRVGLPTAVRQRLRLFRETSTST